MKPRAFVGSSVEGLAVAYAIQQNLLYDAEITVWSQGVFALSRGAVESLLEVLTSSDFGIFVMTPDDIATIRKETSSVIRDNVLFELGLFMGKLGRDRAFFVMPDNVADLHLPSDLVGLTPAKYEGARTDGNMQAATGPACQSIRQQIKKLGLLPNRVEVPSSPETAPKIETAPESQWFDHFFAGRYAEAKQLLDVKKQNETGDSRAISEGWIAYSDLKLSAPRALERMLELAKQHSKQRAVLVFLAAVLRSEQHFQQAIEVLNTADNSIKHDPDIAVALADALAESGDKLQALASLPSNAEAIPELAVKKSELLEGMGQIEDALRVICRAYYATPTDEAIRFRFSRAADAAKKYEISAFLLNKLTKDFPKKSNYWGYLGNVCMNLGLYDQALIAYRAGTGCTDTSVQWIFANIGNLLSNKELGAEACTYLEQVIKIEPTQYAYERYATALKKREAEAATFSVKCQDGMRQISGLLTAPPVPVPAAPESKA
jgi:tetratricopeptide (TPR) repeat protein